MSPALDRPPGGIAPRRPAAALAALWLMVGAAGTPAQTPSVPPAADRSDVTVIDAGPLRLRLYVSTTAQLFHVVDQLSEWSPFCHRQYRREMAPFDPIEEEALARYRELRRRHPWGAGLEQSFYTWLPLDAALGYAVERGLIDQRDGATVLRTMEQLAPRIEPLVAAERARLLWFRDRVSAQRDRLGTIGARLARWFAVPRLEVEAFLIANPSAESYGGGFNGGHLALEIPREVDPMPIFLHELLHAFVDSRRSTLEQALRGPGAAGLDYETLNEGIAHALAPGLYTFEGTETDELRREMEQLAASGTTLADSRLRVLRLASALRPLVAAALESPTASFDDFLPRAVAEWSRLSVDAKAVGSP